MMPTTPRLACAVARAIAPATILGLGLGIAACDSDTTAPDNGAHSFTFETSMEGWQAAGIDLDDPPVEWKVERSTTRARTGDGSVLLHLDNMNDAGKIWMERAFTLEPNTEYDVEIRFAFATQDFGFVNLWSIIAGAHAEPPRDREDLVYQDETGHDGDDDAGYQWLDKHYDLTVQSNADGRVVVAIGVWGTWETPRSYWVDDVVVEFRRR